MEIGLVHIYTGHGKGKTTCAAGLATRAAGRGFRVLWTSFLKDYDSGEFLKPAFDVYEGERISGFFPYMPPEKQAHVKEEHGARLVKVFEKAASEGYDMLVLDEACAAITFGAISEEKLLSLLQNRPKTLEVIITGRDPSEALQEAADYISEICMVKHPYQKGINARIGVEN